MSDNIHATYSSRGLFRCCATVIPVDDKGFVLAGDDGEHRACPFCKTEGSGVIFKNGEWIAAWIMLEERSNDHQ